MNFHSNLKLLGLILLIVWTSVSTTIAIIGTSNTVVAEDNPTNMRNLLERWKQDIDDKPGSQIVFKFREPLLDDDKGNWLSVPDLEVNPQLLLGKIGDDYVCFLYKTDGYTIPVRCTPFSNIVAIAFIPFV